MARPPWSDDLFDGATFIGPLSRLAGADDPPEWNGIGGPNYYHDKAYYLHQPDDRKEVDKKWLELMLLACDALADQKRAKTMRQMAWMRYAFVRAFGWWWWVS